jgi:hypothetical protein
LGISFSDHSHFGVGSARAGCFGTNPKQMEGFAFTLTRDTNNTGLITIARTPGATATIVTRTNISGTGGIIGTITIGIDGSPGAS